MVECNRMDAGAVAPAIAALSEPACGNVTCSDGVGDSVVGRVLIDGAISANMLESSVVPMEMEADGKFDKIVYESGVHLDNQGSTLVEDGKSFMDMNNFEAAKSAMAVERSKSLLLSAYPDISATSGAAESKLVDEVIVDSGDSPGNNELRKLETADGVSNRWDGCEFKPSNDMPSHSEAVNAVPSPVEEGSQCEVNLFKSSSEMLAVSCVDLKDQKSAVTADTISGPADIVTEAANVSSVIMQIDNCSSGGTSNCSENDGKENILAVKLTSSGSGTSVAAGKVDNFRDLVGNYVRSGGGNVGRGARDHIMLGKVTYYDQNTGLYTIVYEDGVHELFNYEELQRLLKDEDASVSGMKMSVRKRKLDLLANSMASEERMEQPKKRAKQYRNDVVLEEAEPSSQITSGSDVSDDADSSSNSSEPTKPVVSEPNMEFHIPDLPPSSGDLAVPEESISHLFSVYNFLRSFSVQLFLSPFGLDEFVCALNCPRQNNLLDAVHLALLRAIRSCLQTLSFQGSEPASRCLRLQDWNLLDAITWPMFLLEYLLVMHHLKDLGGRSFGLHLCNYEYYELHVSTKLRILQILCDEAIDGYKLKMELEAREDYDEVDEVADLAEMAPRAACGRPPKSSACKKIEALQSSDESGYTCLSSKETKKVEDTPEASLDGNSDECRVCGMDGTLVCCDGCPSAYHSRCIGLNKAFLPEGDWFCPECAVNKLGSSSSRIHSGARGAELFGVDVCGRMFVGTCNYLLVVGTSCNSESYTRYYAECDVVKVLRVLSIEETYLQICKRIFEYWNNLPSNLLKLHNEDSIASAMCIDSSRNVGHDDVMKAEESSMDCKIIPPTSSDTNSFSVDGNFVSAKGECGLATGVPQTPKMEKHVVGTAFSSATKLLSAEQHSTIRELTNGSVISTVSYTEQTPLEKRFGSGASAFGSRIDGQVEKAPYLCQVSREGSGNQSSIDRNGSINLVSITKLSSFRPQMYINNYIHGEIAAFAAENISVLAAEGRGVETHSASNSKKAALATYTLQMKAFSVSTPSFVWPNAERKLMEIPRDRCGWCIACKGVTPSSKKGCLLNMAAANSLKRSARNVLTLRTIKPGDDHLPSVIAHIFNMEESLRGLITGSLQDPVYKQQWISRLKEASSCSVIKLLLLELESNIRTVAFSGDWFKFVDAWAVESSDASGVSHNSVNTRRGTGGRRGRRRSVASEAHDTSSDNSWKEGYWCAGGKLSKYVLQRGIFVTASTIRKAARLGGSKKIVGFTYSENLDVPKRNKQYSWRASVDLSNSISHIALQVRYLDAHIKWREFFPPDQTYSDVKGSEADMAAFRNAVICDKKMFGTKTVYALRFPNQKHLPVRVTKNILETENDLNESAKLWFSENHVPLYLIKEFEEKSEATVPAVSVISSTSCYSKLRRKRVKSYEGNVFDYLCLRGVVYACALCTQDVLHRDAVTCSTCQGKCHKQCLKDFILDRGGKLCSALCKSCHAKNEELEAKKRQEQLRLLSQANRALSIQLSPAINAPAHTRIKFKVGTHYATQLASQMNSQPSMKYQKPDDIVQINVGARPYSEPVKPFYDGKLEVHSNNKSSKSFPSKASKRKDDPAPNNWGLIWKTKKNDQVDIDFRVKHIIFKCKGGVASPIEPKCCLCNRSYQSDLMYIRCEKCLNWYHADALNVQESQVSDLLGYKCNKCRRNRRPRCPYNKDGYKPEPDDTGDVNSNLEYASNMSTSLLSNTAPLETEGLDITAEDPLLRSYGLVEPSALKSIDPNLQLDVPIFAASGNQKLSVRRAHGRHLTGSEGTYSHEQLSTSSTSAHLPDANGFVLSDTTYVNSSEVTSPHLEWDYPHSNAYGEMPADGADAYTLGHNSKPVNMETDEFEPQTYFSFTELLAAEDSQLDDSFKLSSNLPDSKYSSYDADNSGNGYSGTGPSIVQDESSMHYPQYGATLKAAECHLCKFTQPSPDLTCEICRIQMHYSCLPWEESAECADGSKWKCSSCRESRL